MCDPRDAGLPDQELAGRLGKMGENTEKAPELKHSNALRSALGTRCGGDCDFACGGDIERAMEAVEQYATARVWEAAHGQDTGSGHARL